MDPHHLEPNLKVVKAKRIFQRLQQLAKTIQIQIHHGKTFHIFFSQKKNIIFLLFKNFREEENLKFDLSAELSRRLYVQGLPSQTATLRMARALKWMGKLDQINNR